MIKTTFVVNLFNRSIVTLFPSVCRRCFFMSTLLICRTTSTNNLPVVVDINVDNLRARWNKWSRGTLFFQVSLHIPTSVGSNKTTFSSQLFMIWNPARRTCIPVLNGSRLRMKKAWSVKLTSLKTINMVALWCSPWTQMTLRQHVGHTWEPR